MGRCAIRCGVVVVGVAAFAACNPRAGEPTDGASEPGFACSENVLRMACDDDDDTQACRTIKILDKPNRVGLHSTLRANDAELDQLLHAIFPALSNKTLANGLPIAASATVRRPGFDDIEVSLPLDWQADPFANRSWRFAFQSLTWLWSSGPPQAADRFETAAAVIYDWTAQALAADSDMEWTYFDHSLALRLRTVRGVIDRYIEVNDVVSRQVLVAAARLIVSHFYALATDVCYTPAHNHGVSQDVAVLEVTRDLPNITDADTIRAHAQDRILAQAEARVSEDGIHGENSPGYQVYFTELLTQAVAAMTEGPARDTIRAHRDRLIEALPHQLQPNLTFAQFGDTQNLNVTRPLERLADVLTAENPVSLGALSNLEWLVSDGVRGAPPPVLDRVFVDGGYAAFRTTWGAAATTVHMTCNHASSVHYQPDEGSFELFSHGRELIVDTGVTTYDDTRWRAYQLSPRRQNVLVVENGVYADSNPTLIDHGLGQQPWVQCGNAPYAAEQVTQVRSLAFAKPDAIAIVDHLSIDGPERTVRQFLHLHPSFGDVDVDERGVVVARPSAPDNPSLVIAPLTAPRDVAITVGRDVDGVVAGWWFPSFGESTPAPELAFEYRAQPGYNELPLLILIVEPNLGAAEVREHLAPTQPSTPTGDLIIEWRSHNGTSLAKQRVTVPRPPFDPRRLGTAARTDVGVANGQASVLRAP